MKNSVFKTEAGRDKIRFRYNSIIERFPFEKKYVETSLGLTFMLVAGQESNPSVVLLHGSCSNSAFWFSEIMVLSNNYRVYAIDIIGEAGNSEEYRPDLRSDAFAIWMKEVFEALGIQKSVVIGNSLGGWMALKFATTYPEYVSGLALIAAGGLAGIRKEFLLNAEQSRQANGNVPVNASVVGANEIPKEVLDFMSLIVENYDPIQDLPIFEDAALERLKMPVLLIVGENDAIIDADQSAKRLSALVPSAEICLLPNCGHVVTTSIELIIPFLSKASILLRD